jgi:hypothetical protein
VDAMLDEGAQHGSPAKLQPIGITLTAPNQ